MSTNRLSHLTEWEKIYLEVTRDEYDDNDIMRFQSYCSSIFVTDNDTFYFPDDLKKLANDGMPKQGEIIKVRGYEWYWDKRIFVSFYKWKVIAANEFDSVNTWDEWRPLPQKTELTLAEVEEKLGIEKGSLIIKD